MLEIRISILEDVEELIKTIRPKDKLEAEALGMSAKTALYLTFKYGLIRRTALLDGKVIAMFGVTGTPLSLIGRPYFVSGEGIEKLSPIKIARIYKEQIEVMNSLFPVLENYVDANYPEAIKLLKIAGFELSPEKINGNDFYKFKKVT